MELKIGQCPVSWGVEEADAASNPPWQQYLDQSAEAGYHGVELGPVGYLPTDSGQLGDALAERGLRLCAGYVMEPLASAADHERILEVTAVTATILDQQNAECLILIDDMHSERSDVAGRSAAGARLDADAFGRLVATAHDVARLVRGKFGIPVAFHPHVGTYVEFRDEIDRFLEATDPELIELCVDSGHSVYAGVDPVDLYKTYSDRVRYMHLKDVDAAIHRAAIADEISFDDAVSAESSALLDTAQSTTRPCFRKWMPQDSTAGSQSSRTGRRGAHLNLDTPPSRTRLRASPTCRTRGTPRRRSAVVIQRPPTTEFPREQPRTVSQYHSGETHAHCPDDRQLLG